MFEGIRAAGMRRYQAWVQGCWPARQDAAKCEAYIDGYEQGRLDEQQAGRTKEDMFVTPFGTLFVGDSVVSGSRMGVVVSMSHAGVVVNWGTEAEPDTELLDFFRVVACELRWAGVRAYA